MRPNMKGAELSEFASVHQGIATGCNAFFVQMEERRRGLNISRLFRPYASMRFLA